MIFKFSLERKVLAVLLGLIRVALTRIINKKSKILWDNYNLQLKREMHSRSVHSALGSPFFCFVFCVYVFITWIELKYLMFSFRWCQFAISKKHKNVILVTLWQLIFLHLVIFTEEACGANFVEYSTNEWDIWSPKRSATDPRNPS